MLISLGPALQQHVYPLTGRKYVIDERREGQRPAGTGTGQPRDDRRRAGGRPGWGHSDPTARRRTTSRWGRRT